MSSNRSRRGGRSRSSKANAPDLGVDALSKLAVEIDDPEGVLRLDEIKTAKMGELVLLAKRLRVEAAGELPRQELVYSILEAQSEQGGALLGTGVLERDKAGYGFLRSPENGYLAGPDDIYVAPSLIRRYGLRTGDTLVGQLRMPRDQNRYFALLTIDEVNFDDPDVARKRNSFDSLTPLFPDTPFDLEDAPTKYGSRILNLLAPIGKGQRGLIVAAPKTGKTVLLQEVASSIMANHPEAYLMVLLIDERPEEVTDMQRSIVGEVLASTFDEPATRHVAVADMVLAKAKRLVEHGRDVVILLDSITRLARAHNSACPPSGRILSGGVDANALQRPKRFFGAARNLEEGGSLTIIATALIDTGSRMDEVIYEEFKGTGNMELHLDRRLTERRIFPSIDINKSGTRREDLLMPEDVLSKVWLLRKVLGPLNSIDSMEFLLDKFKKTKTNQELIERMNG